MRLIKKVLKWYFDRAAETYVWMPSCTIPYIKIDKAAQ